MKKNINLASLLCGMMAFGITSCEDPGDPQFENDEFTSVLYLKDSGQVPVDFYNVNEDIVYVTGIGKGGTDPSIERSCLLSVFTQEEMDAYNLENGTDFVLLPSDCYEFTHEYSFEGATGNQPVNINLKTAIGELAKDIQYVLPLRLTSPEYNVNEKKNTLLLLPTIITPEVSLGETGKLSPISFSVHDNTVTTGKCPITLNLNAANSKWNFTVLCETDLEILKAKVSQFSSESGIDYELLPTENYTLPAFTFNAASNITLDVEINRTNLSASDYLLPLILKSVTGMPFDVASDRICFIHVRIDNKINLEIKNLFANSSENDQALSKVINGLTDDNGWQSMWYSEDTSNPKCDPKYGIYIDIKNITQISEKAKLVLTIKTTHNNPKHIQFYTGTSEGDLKLEHKNEDCYPDRNSNKVYNTGYFDMTGKSMIRIAFITNVDNIDMRKLKFEGNYIKNVAMSEIELYGN